MRPSRRPAKSLLLVLTWWLQAAALAHQPSDSFLTLDTTRNPFTLQWDIALRDLDYLVGLDLDANGALTWGEVRTQRAAIEALARSQLQLSASGRPCSWMIEDHRLTKHSDGTYARLHASIACDMPPDRLHYKLLFDSDPTHRGILRVVGNAGEQVAVLSPDQPTWADATPQASIAQTFIEFWVEGLWHIGVGLDHVLFLLTLLLSTILLPEHRAVAPTPTNSTMLRRTFYVVTGFTLGHSVTLGLATFNVLRPPESLVELAIAATLVLAAINNIYRFLPGPDWLIAGLLGLFHGLGFAAVLDAIGLPLDARIAALAGFNLGVETGQLAIVFVALPLIHLLSGLRFFHHQVAPTASWLVATIGLVWLIERSTAAFGSGW